MFPLARGKETAAPVPLRLDRISQSATLKLTEAMGEEELRLDRISQSATLRLTQPSMRPPLSSLFSIGAWPNH
uniref:Uncharacterized protein n=1 Tax=Candidatus Kentrum sp. FW TaxID=2126338 RepID=A0A450TVN6_9GAMM|nr:MAG: hypothetical protein BECKFW1821C_GA0114237_104138 [Candidatus Kentron sp. FW]